LSPISTPPSLEQAAADGVTAGGTFTITVRVRNPSDTDAIAGASVVDTLPAGATYVPGSARPAPASVSGGRLRWDLGAIAVHEERDITFRARAPGGLRGGTALRSCARLTWWDMLGNPQPAPAPSCADTVARGAS